MTKHLSIRDALIAQSPQVVFCEVAGEAVLLDVEAGKYYALDPVGTAVLQHLQSPATLDQICRRLCDEFDVGPEQCEVDVAALLEELASHGLVKLEPPAV